MAKTDQAKHRLPGQREPVARGTGVPSDRFGLVSRDSISGFIHEAEFTLRRGVPLLGRSAEPLDGFFRIPGHSPFALSIEEAKADLGCRVSCLCGFWRPLMQTELSKFFRFGSAGRGTDKEVV